MLVGISLLTLVPAISGGSETYARELVRALGRVGRHEYRVYLPTIAEDIEGLPSEVVPEYRASRSMPGRIAAMTLASLHGDSLRKRFANDDVTHFPLTVMIPPVDHPPAAATILDLQHEFLPQFFSRAELWYRRTVYARSAQRSKIVVAISEHAARAIVERLEVPENRVRAIHLGIDHSRFVRSEDTPRKGFLLYPARAWPHKNHERLFEAHAELRRRRPGLELVLTSYGGAVPRGVRALGHVPRDQLVQLYQQAGALVFPSLYEGFGQPPLEAMACGCPVACSQAASLPEVVGDGARLFDPESVEDMVDAVSEVLDDPDTWCERGLARAATFTWEATARAHDAVYEALAV